MRSLSQIIILLCLFAAQVLAQSPHGDNFDLDCSLCHQSTSWKIDLKKVEFDHSSTSFDLVGQHKSVDCKSCHQTLKFKEIENTDCISCHTDLHKGTVGKDCARCHTPDSWMVKDIIGLHDMEGFPLVGKHRTADCVQCHSGYVDLNFEATGPTGNPRAIDCYDCHVLDFNSTKNPDHIAAGFSTSCDDCHNINAFDWATVNVVHDFFPLTGGHAIADCFACHTQSGGFTGLSPECDACHHDNYLATTNPNHSQNNFPLDCSQCHTIMSWSPATFDHNLTQFPLTGKHVTVDCSQCHSSGYSNTPMDCYACHQSDYESTDDPNHIQAGFSTDCTECHTTAGWDDANFDHSQTQFPLTGRHIGVDCSTCHQSGYSGTPMDCYACHQSDYENANDPNHMAQGYPTDCTQCHSTSGWDDANFDHSQTAFPLTGAHMTAQCVSCHESGYQGTPTECFSCHSDEFNNTTDPNHQTSGFPNTCDDCHTTSAWTPASFDHNFYPTGNSHNNLTCNECHSEANYQPQCLGCHQDDFNEGHDPGDPTDCWACHSTTNWDSNFNHDNTNFPLTGAHVSLSCQDCHSGGFQGTPTECFACHETNYNNTTNPNHQALSISTTCTDCHTTNPGWSPATYPQHNQVFELLGAHANITNCDDCHNGNYNTTPNTCIGCHSSEYNGTTDPPHQTLNFPQDCLECHNLNGWTPATFDHSFYPTGSHHTNLNCNECHSQSNYDPQCLSCHQDDFNEGHDPGDPTDCWACHSTSNWDSNFDHNNTNFPLTGAHVSFKLYRMSFKRVRRNSDGMFCLS